MKQNWILREAKKADEFKDLVILENPEVKSHIDGLLLNRFWPLIKNKLRKTNYVYAPEEKPELDFRLSDKLQRSLWFMLFDGISAFFRGHLHCSMDSWMLEREFFLGLTIDNDPEVIFEILGNSRFSGNPPTLHVYKNRDNFFQVTFHHASGASWGLYSEEQVVQEIRETIDVNVALYEFSKEGYISEEKVGEFITTTYKAYEAF
jgi:hypothetical protein